jgi:uncharacterized protein YbaP (TraB family)
LLFGQNTILWKVTNPGSKNISYILGTYHLFGESFIDSFPIIKEKLQTTNLVITETKIDKVKATSYYNARPASDTLLNILPKEDVDFIINLFKSRGGQVDITKFTPGELFVKLQALYPKFKCPATNKADKYSMDEYFQYLGNSWKKEQYYFETDSFQLEKIRQVTSTLDWKFFKKNAPSLIAKYKNELPTENLCSFANNYASLTIDYKFEEPCNVLKESNMNDALVKKRNEDWIQKLPILLEKNNCFIAVGLGHLYNKCGLLEQLKGLGYFVESVEMK